MAKRHFFDTEAKLSRLQATMLELTDRYGLTIEAWAVFSNHYHVVLNCKKSPPSIKEYIQHLHSVTAREVNGLDLAKGRKVWFQFWDTQLRTQKSYYARLNYVIQNPVRHGLVKRAEDYEWCSASWFRANSTPAHYKTVTSFPVDRQSVFDEFEPLLPGE